MKHTLTLLTVLLLAPLHAIHAADTASDPAVLRCDLAVIGGGSGGFGAALAGARQGLDVVLVERADRLGGNSVRGGVHCWEMGAGGTGIPFDLYRRLTQIPGAAGIYSYGRHFLWFKPDKEPYRFPGGETVLDPKRSYADTLRRHGTRGMHADEVACRELWHGVVFEPDAMAATMKAMLDETSRCRVLLNTAFQTVRADAGRVEFLQLDDGRRLVARSYVDATGDAWVCLGAGCEVMTGQEARDRFDEPSAPAQPNQNVNGVTLIYRVIRKPKPDAPDSVLRIGCRPDGDTWRYVRSHLRGLLDELQIYDETLKTEDIRFLFEHPGRTAKQRDAVTFAPRFQLDPGHPWRPPFGVERVGLRPVIVQFASITHPAPEHWLAAYREGKEVERKAFDVSGNSPFTARVTFTTSPAPDELVLLTKTKDGNIVEQARWQVERPALEADAKATADPVMNPVDLGAILPPADWLVLGPEQQARVTVAAFSAKETLSGAEVLAWFESAADKPTKAAVELRQGIRTELDLVLPFPASSKDRDTLQVAKRELFDLAKDIGEQQNLAETMPAKADEMSAALIAYLKSVNAETALPTTPKKE